MKKEGATPTRFENILSHEISFYAGLTVIKYNLCGSLDKNIILKENNLILLKKLALKLKHIKI